MCDHAHLEASVLLSNKSRCRDDVAGGRQGAQSCPAFSEQSEWRAVPGAHCDLFVGLYVSSWEGAMARNSSGLKCPGVCSSSVL